MAELIIGSRMKLENLGAESGSINTTRLKERILAVFPDLTDHSQGRDTILVLKHEIGEKPLNEQRGKIQKDGIWPKQQ